MSTVNRIAQARLVIRKAFDADTEEAMARFLEEVQGDLLGPDVDWLARTERDRNEAGHAAWDEATELLDATAGDMPQPWRGVTIALLAEQLAEVATDEPPPPARSPPRCSTPRRRT